MSVPGTVLLYSTLSTIIHRNLADINFAGTNKFHEEKVKIGTSFCHFIHSSKKRVHNSVCVSERQSIYRAYLHVYMYVYIVVVFAPRV